MAAIGICLLNLTLPAKADVKILEYNKDGTVRSIIRGEDSKTKKDSAKPKNSGQTRKKEFSPADRYVKGELIVVNPSRSFENNVTPLGFGIVERLQFSSLELSLLRLRTPAKYSVSEAKAFLSKKFSGISIDANHIYDITGTPVLETDPYPQLAAFVPVPAGCGRGIRIGMIDGGVNVKHPALAGQKIQYRKFISKGAKPGPAYHGTAIAAMFIGKLPKQGLGGLLPAADILAANVQEVSPSSQSMARVSNILRAIDWLVSEQVHVINFNIAGANNEALRTAVDRAQRKGVIMVASVGNWGQKSGVAFPAAYAPVIGVTSVDKYEKIYARSNRGRQVDFSAMGVRIWAANSVKGGQYASGTSFATPMISSLSASVIKRGKISGLKGVRTYLKELSTDIGPTGKDSTFGWGVVDLPSICE